MKTHYNFKNTRNSGRLFKPMWEWNNFKIQSLRPVQEITELPQWHKELIFARHELLKNTHHSQLLDFDTAMDEIERDL